MSRGQYYPTRGPACPGDPEHGPVYPAGEGRYHCPHVAHVAQNQTQFVFTEQEVNEAMEARRVEQK